MIYFDNAATTKCCEKAISAYVESFKTFGNTETKYKLGLSAKKLVEQSKKVISDILNASEKNIIFNLQSKCK